ncbi:hypothetical protein [Streptomyces melanogenes]|uniref:hypothetical protein n=1 Tax=Streptomyces melanogenes TaxID=67326 RepID=UPI00167CF050|nr:hypothetical protein [Streptomyces melanogenes]GGP93120.1 hypothetical protein GCM10010278_83920 [Streptomyces melanogenes]
MSAAAARVGRFYTTARRHPWVLGKVADWKIPLGPYTPAQIAVAVGGGLLLVKTISWWSWMGPVPVAAWVLAVWTVRRPKMRGRAPVQAAVGWVLLGWQPRRGRIGGRAARDRVPQALLGSFTIEAESAPATSAASLEAAAASARGPRRSKAAVRRPSLPGCGVRTAPAGPAAGVRPVSAVQQLRALSKSGGVR